MSLNMKALQLIFDGTNKIIVRKRSMSFLISMATKNFYSRKEISLILEDVSNCQSKHLLGGNLTYEQD